VNPKRIFCKQSIYHSARQGEQKAIGTLAHEVGHYVLHPAKEIRFLATDGNKAPFDIHPNESAERQACLFADALLMPSWSVGQVDSAVALADLCNVGIDRATQRWNQIRQTNVSKCDVTDSILEAWDKAEQIPGETRPFSVKPGFLGLQRLS
jgi:hypothetical protein